MSQDHMIYRENRQRTFEEPLKLSWGTLEWKEEQNPNLIDELVNSGFYYAPTLMDKSRIICAYCNGEEILDEIPSGMDVSHVHSKGNCLWSIARVGMVDSLRYKTKRSIKSYWKKQKYTILSDPLSKEAIEFRRSFFTETYPLDIGDQRPNSRSLSEAGFIYSPNHLGDDRVVCIYCGCALDYWESGDDPIGEHRKNETSYCYFLDLYTEHNKKKRQKKPVIVEEVDSSDHELESIMKVESVKSLVGKQNSPIVIEPEEIIDKQEEHEKPSEFPVFFAESKSPYEELHDSSTILNPHPTYSKSIKRRFRERDLNVEDISSEDIAGNFIKAAKLSQENSRKNQSSMEVVSESSEEGIDKEDKNPVDISSSNESSVKMELGQEEASQESIELESNSEENGESQPVLSESEDEVETDKSSSSEDDSIKSASEDEYEESSVIETESDDDYVESEDSEVIEISTPEGKPHKKRKIMESSPQKDDTLMLLDDKEKATVKRNPRKRNSPDLEDIHQPKIPKKTQRLNLKKLHNNYDRETAFDTSLANIDYGESNVEQLENIIITSQIEPSGEVAKEKDVHIPKLSPIKFAGKRKSVKRSNTTKSRPSIFDVSFEGPPKRLTLGTISPKVETKKSPEREKVENGYVMFEDIKDMQHEMEHKTIDSQDHKMDENEIVLESDSEEQKSEKIKSDDKPPKSKLKLKQEEPSKRCLRTRNSTRQEKIKHRGSLKDKVNQNISNKSKAEVLPSKIEVKQSHKDPESDVEIKVEVQAMGEVAEAKQVKASETVQEASGKDSESEELDNEQSKDTKNLQRSPYSSNSNEKISLSVKFEPELETELDVQPESEDEKDDEDYVNYLLDIKSISEDIDRMIDSGGAGLSEAEAPNEMDIDEIDEIDEQNNNSIIHEVDVEEKKLEKLSENNEVALSFDSLEHIESNKRQSPKSTDRELREQTYKENTSPTHVKAPLEKEASVQRNIKENTKEDNKSVATSKKENSILENKPVATNKKKNSILENTKSESNLQHSDEEIPTMKDITLPKLPNSNEPITSPLAMCSSPMPGSKHSHKDHESDLNSTIEQKSLNRMGIDESVSSRNSHLEKHKGQLGVKWDPKSVTEMLEKMNYLRSSAEEVKKLANSNYGLHDDVNGDLTRFIGEMPEEEEGMTIKEWIEHCAGNCYDIILQNGEETRQFLKEEYLRAIAAVEALPTDD